MTESQFGPNKGRDTEVALREEVVLLRAMVARLESFARSHAERSARGGDEVARCVADEIAWTATDFGNRLNAACESPIEWAMWFSLQWFWEFYPDLVHDIRAQVETETGHRVDFVVSGHCGEIVIECDGHDFHERTREQAERDRRRDRELQFAGYVVCRFTGTEIVRSPAACSREVFAYLSKQRSDERSHASAEPHPEERPETTGATQLADDLLAKLRPERDPPRLSPPDPEALARALREAREIVDVDAAKHGAPDAA